MLVRLNHIYAIDPTLEELGKEDLMMGATQEEAWLDPLNLYIETTGEKYKLLKSLSVPPSLACNFIAIYRYGKLSELLLIKMRSSSPNPTLKDGEIAKHFDISPATVTKYLTISHKHED